jgi:hypothetical protein
MLYYDKLYKKVGIRKLSNFIKPNIIDSNTFIFPYSSLLYWFKQSNVDIYLSKEYSYLKNTKKVFVKSIFTYDNEDGIQLLGNFKPIKKSTNSIIGNMMKEEKNFKFLKSSNDSINLQDKHLLIINYGSLTNMYKYQSNPYTRYHKWYNAFSKTVSQLKSKNTQTNRHKYLLLDIPDTLPPLNNLNMFIKRLSVNIIENLPSYSYLNILELWKFLTPIENDSLLKTIPDSDINNITLILCMDNKISLLNLGILKSLVKDYNHEGIYKLSAHSDKIVKKLLYIMLNNIINLPSKDIKDIDNENNKYTIKVSTSGIIDVTNDGKEEEPVDLDALVDEYEQEDVKEDGNNLYMLTKEYENDEVVDDIENINALEVNNNINEVTLDVDNIEDLKYKEIDIY